MPAASMGRARGAEVLSVVGSACGIVVVGVFASSTGPQECRITACAPSRAAPWTEDALQCPAADVVAREVRVCGHTGHTHES